MSSASETGEGAAAAKFSPGVLRIALLSAILFLAQSPSLAFAEDGLTLKERLSDKASDDQRVDNCHVPVERRGMVPRPDCSKAPDASRARGKNGSGSSH